MSLLFEEYIVTEDIFNISITMTALVLVGCYFFFNTDNGLVKLINDHYKYNQEKLSRFLGISFWAIALSCTPTLLSAIYNKLYLNIFSIIIFVVIMGVIGICERRGKLK